MNGIVVKFPQDSPAIVHISLGTMNVKYETKKSLTLLDPGGGRSAPTLPAQRLVPVEKPWAEILITFVNS